MRINPEVIVHSNGPLHHKAGSDTTKMRRKLSALIIKRASIAFNQ
jgi:hypothetical protein